ncbi:hypothetical protein CVT25_009263 [Psilocybe cyanescens]|uniref:Uncharacterized protein n=1 Tax=Psilocybe cyanescens TaxID=93625 RepID=A0A409XTF3_PSICY|nr:hypothetical protein CVT25_009263 [Psilocybe cyanescens]
MPVAVRPCFSSPSHPSSSSSSSNAHSYSHSPRRRRITSSDLKVLAYLYRMVTYGVERWC